MKNAIVTTTINYPTPALEAFAAMHDWQLIIMGDQRTPKNFCLAGSDYYSPEKQEKLFPTISGVLGWNTITRRNIGFLIAYKEGYEVVATVDDDNQPLENWGLDIKVGKQVWLPIYDMGRLFDPLFVTEPTLWHRGFPWQALHRREICDVRWEQRHVLVQADLWHGEPDIDAICRMTVPTAGWRPPSGYFGGRGISPFNSQNTFLHRSVLPAYMMLTGVGRVQDIWGGYRLQWDFPESVIYGPPSVIQTRNPHDLVDDLVDEIDQYRFTFRMVTERWLPSRTESDFSVYRGSFSELH